MIDYDNLYKSIMGAEHQGYLGTEGYDPWIRTKYAPEGGSSAFGPVQLTGGKGSMMANVAGGYSDIGASQEELDWIRSRYLPQAQNFLKYGKEPDKEGYDVKYEYGGSGDFTDEDKLMYENVAKKLMKSEYERTGGDMDKFIQSWRGKTYDEDPEYYDHIKKQNANNNIGAVESTMNDYAQTENAFTSPSDNTSKPGFNADFWNKDWLA